MAGQWEGTLSYRDYSQDRWFDLPQNKKIEVLADGHSFLESSRYDDGPSGIVYIYALSALEPDGKTLKSLSTRAKRAATVHQEVLSLGSPKDTKDAFTLVSLVKGEDDDRPATLKVTLTYKDNVITTLKEVDFLDDTKSEWLVRNKTKLNRLKP